MGACRRCAGVSIFCKRVLCVPGTRNRVVVVVGGVKGVGVGGVGVGVGSSLMLSDGRGYGLAFPV